MDVNSAIYNGHKESAGVNNPLWIFRGLIAFTCMSTTLHPRSKQPVILLPAAQFAQDDECRQRRQSQLYQAV
jgi:hypothetical protein